MANQSITVSPSNSPYFLPAPSVSYDTVTIQPGGYIVVNVQTTVTIATLTKG
jgi:hypothetical protein